MMVSLPDLEVQKDLPVDLLLQYIRVWVAIKY